MSDEQTIYISPEDDLTTVRERLEHVQTRSVTLVIPAQTQLRSHVAWKLLYARARQLGKEVLIVSSDPQVRSVAHAVKFSVAHSLEATQQGKSRPASRPTRNNAAARMKGTVAPSTRSANANAHGTRSTNGLQTRQQEARPWSGAAADNTSLTGRRNRSNYQADEPEIEDLHDEPLSSTFQRPENQKPEKRYGKGKEKDTDFRFGSPPSIRPLSPEQIDEEPDLLLEDYTMAQGIRQAVNSRPREIGTVPTTPSLDENDVDAPRTEAASGAIEDLSNDPFSHIEDLQSPPIREQRGNAFIEDTNAQVPNMHTIKDVSELPTSVVEPGMHYIDEEDDFQTSSSAAHRPGPGIEKKVERRRPEELEENDVEDIEQDRGPARDLRPRRQHPRTGYMAPGQPSSRRPQPEDLEDDDFLPVEERHTRAYDPDGLNYDPPTRTPSREPHPVQLPVRGTGAARPATRSTVTPRPGQQRPSANLVSGTPRPQPRPKTLRPSAELATPSRRPVAQKNTKRRSRTILIGVVIVCILLLLLAYAIPTSTITLQVASRDYSHPVSVTATTGHQPNSVLAQVLTHTFTRQGQESVTGTKMVSTAKAQGNVCFSNNGNTDVTIPTGSIIASAGNNNVQFVTTAEPVIPHNTTCASDPQPIPVQAVNAGESGNVPAGAVTIIPATSLEQIAKYNNITTRQLNLSVTNSADITGGGMSPVPAIAQKDLDNAKQDLHQQLQDTINNWVKSLPKDGAIGKLVTTDTLINAPAVGTTIDTGKNFQAELQVSASVLFASNSDLSKAAFPQLNTAMQRDKNYANYALVNANQQPSIAISNITVRNSNISSMQINFTATGRAAEEVSASSINQIKSIAAGNTPANASHLIETQIPGVHTVTVTTNPSFMPITRWQGHIDVKIIPDPVPSTK